MRTKKTPVRIACGAALLGLVALMAWRWCSPQPGDPGRPVPPPRDFPTRFAQSQAATQRGTAPYVLTLADGASKREAIMAVKTCGARVVGPHGPDAFLVETSIFALGKLSQDTNFVAAAELLPEEKVRDGFAGGRASIRMLSAADVGRCLDFLDQKGVRVCDAPDADGRRDRLEAEIPSEVLPELLKLGEVREVAPRTTP